jgi:hypothetical protein
MPWKDINAVLEPGLGLLRHTVDHEKGPHRRASSLTA